MAKILLDTCVWGGAVEPLKEAGHDVDWTGLWEADPGDTAILQQAYSQKQILVTLDKDFGELAIVKGQPHSGIIRLLGFSVLEMAGVMLTLVGRHEPALMGGAIIVATPSRIRVRLPG